MAQVDSWTAIAGAAVTAAAALGGVVLTQRATRQRDQDARLWDKRADSYVNAIRWLLDLRQRVTGPDGEAIDRPGTPAAVRDAHPPNDLEAEISAYASDRVRSAFESCLRALATARQETYDSEDSTWRSPAKRLLWAIEHVLEEAREELHGVDSHKESLRERLGSIWFTVSYPVAEGRRRLRMRLSPQYRARMRDQPTFHIDE